MIKEYCEYANTCVIRERAYGSRMSKFLKLIEVAKNDFPGLKDEDIEIVKYAGERYAKTFGIEFTVPDGLTVQFDYNRISQLEYTQEIEMKKFIVIHGRVVKSLKYLYIGGY